MSNVQATVRAFARDSESPARVCTQVNQVLCGNITPGKFVTFFYGVLDSTRHTLQYCNAGHAGHPIPILVSGGPSRNDSGEICEMPSAEVSGNGSASFDPIHWTSLRRFHPPSTSGRCRAWVFPTWKYEAAVAKENRANSAATLNEKILSQVTAYCTNHFQDDATLLAVAAT